LLLHYEAELAQAAGGSPVQVIWTKWAGQACSFY